MSDASPFDRVVDPLIAEQVLQEVLLAPPETRHATLERLCGDDLALRTEVKSLLRHLPDPEDPEHPSEATSEIALEGRIIGGCRIEHLLGRGGTGRVFRAMQEWPPRPVAVKVLRPELLGESARRRFRREARALARLDHPGIARILSAGLHREGHAELPFVVMEVVEGARPITEWWRGSERPLGDRLEAFACVCDAVHHGHVRGLVHRDLKPSNVLVGSDDRPRVIDFSVAAITADDGSMMTLTRAIAGTPGYMAPEQFEAANAVDLRTDVHALGLLLFECLSGRAAYAREGLTIAAAARIITTEAVPSLAAAEPSHAGDLDTIVAHALAKEPGDRYQSAAELAADLRRHLSGHPIVAKPATPLHRARLFMRRNPVAAAAIAVAVAAVALGSIASVAFGIREFRAAKVAERALAETERALWRSRLSDFARAIETSDLAMINVLRGSMGEDASWPARLMRALSDESLARLDGTSLFETFSAMGGAISPDGTVLAVVMHANNGVVLLDPVTLAHIRTLSPGVHAWSLAFDPVHGRLLVAEDRTLFVWPKPWVDPPRRITLPFEYGTGIAASPDGTRVALASEGNTCVVDIDSGRVIARSDIVSGSTTRVAWSPDGSMIAVGVEPKSVRLYRPDDLSEIMRLPADGRRTLALDFDPSGRWLAFAGDLRKLHVVELANPTNHRVLPLDYSVWGLAWNPDGRRIAVADRGSGVRIVDVPTDGSALSLVGSYIGHGSEVWCVDWNRTGDRLYSIGQTQVHVWDGTPHAGAEHHELGSPGLTLAHQSDGTALALTADASVWSVAPAAGSLPRRTWSSAPFEAMSAAADAPRGRFAWMNAGGTLRIAEPASGQIVTVQHPVFAEGPSWMQFSPSGARIAVVGSSPADPLLLVDARTGGEIARLAVPWQNQAAGIAWIDDDTLMTGSFSHTLEVRRGADGRWSQGRTTPGSFFAVRTVTPERHVFAATMSGNVVERDLVDGSVVRTYDRLSDMATCTTLSPDGSLLVASGTDRRLHVFERDSTQQLLSLMGHRPGRRVMAVDFSAGGDRVSSLDTGGGLVIWDTRPASSRRPTADATQ